jgi:hypothetical protein
MIRRQLSMLFAAIALWNNPAVGAGNPGRFQVDQSKQALSADAMASLEAQLRIVESVGLPPAILASMKNTAIVVDPDLTGNPGIFAVRNGIGAVYIRPVAFSADKPILLHELLHAYHFSTLGMGRPEIRQAFERVQKDNPFPARYKSAHFLENPKEFFAVTATLYLFGDIQQAPFSCAALAKLDKDYLGFLDAQFGLHRCASLAGTN